MLFNSVNFVVFFALVLAAYWVLPMRWQNRLLLVASYFFYGCWDWRFLALIWFSSTVDYLVAPRIRASDGPGKKRWLAVSLVTNLGILGLFKYFNFFSDSAVDLLNALGFEASYTTLRIVLPVGISFYTFQTMSYSVDVYRGHVEPSRNYFRYLLYVSFFPQLVAGPIERASHLLGQFDRRRSVHWGHIREGAWLILLGYFKKVVMADNLALFVDDVFNRPAEAQGLSILVAIFAFCFQIYGDFSGYSDLARGTSRLLGFDLMVNFRLPNFALTPADYWRRWHISLSTWLRDYLYIPLGGNRNGNQDMYRNITITMLLGGLWHGAAWNFIAWGAFQCALLIVYRMFNPFVSGWLKRGVGHRLWAMLVFFLLNSFARLLFRANQMADVPVLLRGIFDWAWNGKLALLSLFVFVTPLLLLEIAQERSGDLLVVKRWPPAARLLVYAAMVALILLTGAVSQRQFIYFQF